MPDDRPSDGDTRVNEVLDELNELKQTVDSTEERRRVKEVIGMVETMSFSKVIEKYTTRDMAQTFVGGILLSLPLLVEDGVFEIAKWFLETTVAGIPVLLSLNILFILVLTYGLIYWADIRQVRMRKIFGIFPRRLVGVVFISFFTAAFLLVLWGRHLADDPGSNLEIFARVTVIWAAAAFGGALGDILPGEGSGEDINKMLEDMLSGDGEEGQNNG